MKTYTLATCMTVFVAVCTILVFGTHCCSEDDVAVSAAAGRTGDVKADVALKDVRSALQNKQYGEAVELIDTLMSVADTDKDRDFMMYLKGLALFYDGEYDRAIGACDRVIEDETSAWRRKATFLKAQCHIRLKQFQEAEGIYDTQVRRLLSEARKEEIAGVYFRFAEALSRKPGKDELDAPPPDYRKAYELYNRTLELEIGRDMKDETMFRLGRMMQLAGDYGQAVNYYRQYLDEFDPDWMGAVDSPRRQKKTGTLKKGKHVHEARYHIAECQLAQDQMRWGRMNLEDLLRMVTPLSDKASEKLTRDARFLIIRTYHIPGPRSDEELELGVKAVRDFLNDFPGEPRGMSLAFQIGESYQNRGRSEEAISAYQDFLKVEYYEPSYDEEKDEKGESHAERYQRLRMSATYRIGEILFRRKDYAGAMKIWSQYIAQFPNGPQWTNAQQGIVNAEFQTGVDLLADEKYDEAVVAWDKFLEKHPLDGRSRQIMFVYGQLHYHKAEGMEKAGEPESEEYKRAVSEWEKLVNKYPNTEESSLALFRIGRIYEEELGELEKALESYRKLNWGSWYDDAQRRIQEMTNKKLQLVTERVFRTSEKAKVKVTLRNIEKLTVNVYRVDLEAYWRKMHGIKGVEKLDIALIAPDKSWEYQVEGYGKYKLFEREIEIPIDKAGVYVVNLGEEDLEATTLVIRSDIDAIIKTSRKEVLVFAQDMLENKPASGARVLVSDGSKVIGEGETGADGVFHKKLDGLKDTSNATVFVVRDGSVASDLVDMSGLGLSEGLTSRGYIYTDRPAYRPGGKVSIKGIIRDVKDGSYSVSSGAEYEISILDSQGRLLRSEEVKLSAFGTFHTEMPLDESAPVGEYRITAQDTDDKDKTFTGSFRVERYQLEKMKLALEFGKRVYFRGEEAEATFTASYYYGQPVSGKPIRYVLPDGRSYTEETDAEGKLKVTFDTTPMQPDSTLMFHGSIEGENVQIRDAVLLARLGFSITVKPSAETVISGEPFDVFVTTTGADGKPVGNPLTLTVYQQMEVKTHPILSQIPWLRRERKPSGEVKISEHKLTTDGKTGKGTLHLSLEEGGRYILRASGADRFDQPVSGEDKIFISDDKDSVKLRIFSRKTMLKVGEDEGIRIHSRLDASLALLTFEGEGIISHRVEQLTTGWNDIPFTVGNEHFPNFHISVSVMDDQELRTAGRDFTVERELVISLKVADTYQPGEEAEIEVTATDQLGNPVAGELSLALVDEALFSIYPDTLTRITAFFNEGIHRDAAMRTASSCTFSYHAITQRVLKELLEEAQRLDMDEDFSARRGEVLAELNGMISLGVPVSRTEFADIEKEAAELSLGDDRARDKKVRALGKSERAAAQAPEAALKYYDMVQAAEAPMEGIQAGTWAGRVGLADVTVREEFADAGYWLPAVVTDASGKATAKIPMPEKTTQWRLTARGCTVETLVGQTTAKTITRKEFFLDIKLPSILAEGDKIRVLARVHNLTESEGKAELRLKLTVDDDTSTSMRTIEIQKNGTTEIVFDEMKILAGREAQVEVIAAFGNMTDGVSRTIPIRPWGMEYADSAGGLSSGDETVFLELPGDRRYTSRRMTLSVGPDVNRLIFDLAMGTITSRGMASTSRIPPMPGDAGSDLLAAAYALDYLKQVDGDPVDNRRLLACTRGLVARLVVSQRDDGGWSWCHGSAGSDIYTSSRNLWALAEAQRQGVSVHARTMEKARTYLKAVFAQAQQNDNETKSVILHALSLVGDADFAYANRLYRNRNQMSPSALAYTALIFANLDRKEIGGEILDVLQGKVMGRGDRPVIMFESGRARGVDDLETSALTLLALESIRPSSPLVQRIVEYLLSRRTYSGYSPHKARGPVVAALATYYGKARFAASDYRLEISVNGKEVKKAEVRGQQPTMLIHVPTKHIKSGRNRIEFRLAGMGSYSYTATLSGFSPELRDPRSWDRPHVRSRKYYHAPLEYKGRQIASSSSLITQLEEGQRTYVSVDIKEGSRDRYIIVNEYLPAGTMLVEDSISGQYQHYEVGDGIITFYYPPGTYMRDYRYQLVSYAPGVYRALPTVIQDTMRPGDMRIGKATILEVLAPGEKSRDEYRMNHGELYGFGKAYFDDGIYDEALSYLSKLYDRSPTYQQREVARMLLWIHTEDIYYDAEKVVQYFEILRERFPELYIPFDKILVVGRAYRDIEEYERAYLVYKATIDASFINDSNVSAVLEDEGQFLSSIDFQENLWREYPDTPQVTSSYFALSQAIYSKVPVVSELRNQRVIPLLKGQSESKPEKISKLDLLKETVLMLSQFLTLYPDDPLADDATFSLANALLDLEDFTSVVTLCQTAQKRYLESEYLTSFQYVEALGFFSQRRYDEAVDAATIVADGKSKDRDLARYILGQIYHARGKPDMAIDWYGKVKGIYPDAQESISYFQEKRVSLDEVKVVRPDDDAKITIKYRNIKEVAVQVYRVDLMKLYLREKDLSKIRSVQLAGISPQFSKTTVLGDGKDYVDKEHEMALDLEGEGAYLVICRGDDLFSSGLVLITPLDIEVQEDAVSGRVRVNVRDVVKDTYREGVHVKAVGSAEKAFRSGETDLRGLFIADDIRGKATVIAREGKNLYAFYRGKQWLGAPEKRGRERAKAQVQQERYTADYRANIDVMNQAIQGANVLQFDQMRRGGQKGVQVQMAQ